jgi:hypothetical protein
VEPLPTSAQEPGHHSLISVSVRRAKPIVIRPLRTVDQIEELDGEIHQREISHISQRQFIDGSNACWGEIESLWEEHVTRWSSYGALWG